MHENQDSGSSSGKKHQCNCSRKKIKNYVPYRKLYDVGSKRTIFWIPKMPVKLSVENASTDSKLIKIELEHGKFKWEVVKKARDFAILSRYLRRHRALQKIPRPRLRRRKNQSQITSMKHDEYCPCNKNRFNQKPSKDRPNFNQLNHPSSSEENQRLINQELENWLLYISNSPNYQKLGGLIRFFEVTPFSFLNEFDTKNQEGVIKIRYIKDNKFYFKNIKDSVKRWFCPWKKRWLLVKHSFVAFVNVRKKFIEWVILFDEGFQINAEELKYKINGENEFIISDQNQALRLRCNRVIDAQRWKQTFASVLNSDVSSIWLKSKRFGSSYPPRQYNFCQSLVDGESFYDKIADMIELAKDEIFIGSWWICPELYMKRPMAEGDKWRLDQMLCRAAKRGVHIFILQYNELTGAFGHNSLAGKKKLKKLHKNIKIMRHPDHLSDEGTIMWSHHDKFLVIDQLIGFIGGTDLCFGRWDNEKHPIKDLGSIAYVPSKFSREVVIQETMLNSEIGEKEEEKEQIMVEKFKADNVSEGGDSIENYKIKYTQIQNTRFNIDGLKGRGLFYPGKEYVNLNVSDFTEVDQPFRDQIDRYAVPRLPWHDVNAVIYGESARDLARHFIQRWNATKAEKFRNNRAYPYLVPKSYDSIQVPEILLNDDTYKCECQVLRSAAEWSAGINKVETSILGAYKSLIANAKHYIYIENLYFVSMVDSEDVTNGICEVLCDRIVRADRNNENFRAFIMLPLRPGYPGDIKKDEYSTLIVLLHLSYSAITRGPNSLVENLKKRGVSDPWKYISITSLRTYDDFCGKLETEMIYIHTKMMLVDDMHVILGSANINDRSLLGDRDSEVDMLISDSEFFDSKMDGKPYKAGKFAYSLRQRLMKESLGLLPGMPHCSNLETEIDIEDPISDKFFNDNWKFYAKQNTQIYEEVFHTFPTDRVETFDELTSWREENPSQKNPEWAKNTLEKINGYIIEFPLNFLVKEDLSPQFGTKELLIPTDVYT